MPARRVKEALDQANVAYETISHARTYTAQETAASAHVPGKEMAKTVILKVDGRFAMAVLPASRRLDLDHFRTEVRARRVELSPEPEFRNLFPESEPGAMAPFGNLYGMDVYVDRKLAEDEQIAFNAGSHTQLIRMRFSDFDRLVRPRVLDFSRPENRILRDDRTADAGRL